MCELDIVFNFEKAHHILDEYMLGGEVQESSMKTVVSAIHQMDLIQEVGRLFGGGEGWAFKRVF